MKQIYPDFYVTDSNKHRVCLYVRELKMNIVVGNFDTKKEAALQYKNVSDEWYGKELWGWRNQDHPHHASWRGAMNRCYSKGYIHYKDYGGRGIKVCDSWKQPVIGFKRFVRDMGEKPIENYSLDRINNDKGYSPDNCRWASSSTQNQNQRVRSDNMTGVRGISIRHDLKNKYYVEIQSNKKRYYIGSFNSMKKAVHARNNAELKFWGEKND